MGDVELLFTDECGITTMQLTYPLGTITYINRGRPGFRFSIGRPLLQMSTEGKHLSEP